MDSELPATIRIRPHRWPQWTVVGVAILAAITASRYFISDPREIEQSRGVKLGMTQSEVFAIVGMPHCFVPVDRSLSVETRYGARASQLYGFSIRCKDFIGWKPPTPSFIWPVAIRYGPDGRVNWIKRGSEIVGSE
jgi:hypothetical protein